MMLSHNISVAGSRLLFAGQDTVELAQRYGTPLYLLDEDRIRENCRRYLAAFRSHFGGDSRPCYASKANSFKAIYRVMQEEGMGIDVVSAGEIYTAKQAGYDMANACFHGNSKTDEDVAFAMDMGVGCFVADNGEELSVIEREAAARGIRQKILLRVTPGIDPHTYEAVSTGKVDSKFGRAIETGDAESFLVSALEKPHIHVIGYHCHVGSQVFEEDVFERTAEIMLRFSAEMEKKHGYRAETLDLGGGFGVRYLEEDPTVDVSEKIAQLAKRIRTVADGLGIPVPVILMEPGRSIVADAGMTLYTVGALKKIEGYKNYVSVDGGMTDNPRYALYGSRYTCFIANRMDEECTLCCDLVGRCCESGDIIQPNVFLPAGVQRGDIAAVCTTGAYNYSMASNYNRIPRPPVVMLSGGESRVAVRRETLEDLCACDL